MTDATTEPAAPDPRAVSVRVSPTPRVSGDGGRWLASAVSYNAIFSGVNGVVLLAGAPMLSRPIGAAGWVLAALGGGLLGFAVLLVWLLAAPHRLAVGARFVLVADLAWVVGAVVVLAGFPELLAPAGRVGLAAVSVVVAAMIVGQAAGLRRRGQAPMTATSPVQLQVDRIVAAPVGRVWATIADAGDYGRFAPGIAHTAIVAGDGEGEGQGEGMVRVCRDDRGAEWAETCTLWEDGHRYRMTVDVSSYPAHYRVLLERFAQTWTLEPVPGGTRIRLAFDGAVRLGVLGRAAVRLLGRPRRLEAILDNYERDLTVTADAT